MQVAILAGGLATRLGILARNQPKSMLEVHGKAFLEYQLELLQRSGIEKVVLCIGHMASQIERHISSGKKYGMEIKCSFEDKPLGTAGALRKAEPLLDDPFFTIYGDSYIFLDFNLIMQYFRSQDKLALMTVYKNNNRYDRSNTVVKRNLIKRYSKDEKSEDMVYIEYGGEYLQERSN
ncbi:sugar phosphate nucleotidyltransferase [Chloroflexota bacterium]